MFLLLKCHQKNKMIYPDLIYFIKESRKRGLSDSEIKKLLLENNWKNEIINENFSSLHLASSSQKPIQKKSVTINLDSSIITILEKRAKKNMMNLNEQIEDIIRRSAVNARVSSPKQEKLDDLLIPLFSRKRN